MKKKIILPAALLVSIATFLFWWFSSPQVLKRRSIALLECVHLEPGTSRIQRAHKAEKLKDLIATHLSVTYPEVESSFGSNYTIDEAITVSEDQAKSALLYLTETAEWIRIDRHSIEILECNEQSAKVSVSFTISNQMKGSSEHSTHLNGILSFSKEKSKWQLHSAAFSK